MLITSFKPGHDGTIAIIEDGVLLASLEAENDSFPRYDRLGPVQFIECLKYLKRLPDVFCLSGWPKGFHSTKRSIGAGYFGSGPENVRIYSERLLDKDIQIFCSTHERAHVYCAIGLSPFADRSDCYCLIWEGNIGRFYRVSKTGEIRPFPEVLSDPGNKYAFLYALADPFFPAIPRHFRFEDAGKLMALAAYADSGPPSEEETEVISWILSQNAILLNHSKEDLKDTKYYNIGVTHPSFCRLARRFSDEIFERFGRFARDNLHERLPLVIAGGCGLNCDWNYKWRASNIFQDVFIPPCTNDTGAALGTAIEAQLFFEGRLGISWSVYCGQLFETDVDLTQSGIVSEPLLAPQVAGDLLQGKVIPLVQGRCEMGPRALGNRSILAAPFSDVSKDLLNSIKKREPFRPIAPVVLQSDVSCHFDGLVRSPFMLEFATVKDQRLNAIRHVDNSARPQTVDSDQNPTLCAILEAFRQASGVAVLCNTSLNFPGRGFINRMSDLAEFCRDHKLARAVVNESYLQFET